MKNLFHAEAAMILKGRSTRTRVHGGQNGMNLKWKPWNEAFTSSLSLKIASFKNAFALLALLSFMNALFQE